MILVDRSLEEVEIKVLKAEQEFKYLIVQIVVHNCWG